MSNWSNITPRNPGIYWIRNISTRDIFLRELYEDYEHKWLAFGCREAEPYSKFNIGYEFQKAECPSCDYIYNNLTGDFRRVE